MNVFGAGMQVAPNTYLVASGAQGFGLTQDLDCNCWLFDAGDDLVLFDAGAGLDVDGLFARMKEDGLALERLTYVFLTHGHGDHSGGAFELKDRTGAKLVCGVATRSLLDKGESAISLDVARAAGVDPVDYRYRPPSPDETIEAGAVFDIGTLRIVAIDTPGHSLDHMSYLVEMQAGAACMVSGDAVFHSGRIIYQGTYDFDVRQSAQSIRTLATHEFETLLPGHGVFARRRGRRHVEAALRQIDQLKTPRAIEFVDV
jgi:hydroxyacylglutathione hydrolase